jgi:hypothetical protein
MERERRMKIENILFELKLKLMDCKEYFIIIKLL